jgi:hypothetical protein
MCERDLRHYNLSFYIYIYIISSFFFLDSFLKATPSYRANSALVSRVSLSRIHAYATLSIVLNIDLYIYLKTLFSLTFSKAYGSKK